MTINMGKVFENDLKKSVPESVFYLRLKDSGGFGKSEATRFSSFNIADCLIFDGENLFVLELKSHKGRSLPLSCIRAKQLEGLIAAGNFLNIVSGIIVNFRDVEQTYFLEALDLKAFIATSDRKSIPIDYFREHGVVIHQTLKKTHYAYLVNTFLDLFRQHPIGQEF